MASDSKTGKGGSITYNGANLTITSWKAKSKKEMAKSTDSSNYVSGSKQLWTAQLPGEQNLTIDVEGNWSAASTPSGLIAQLQQDPPVNFTLLIDPTTPYCSGKADLSDIETALEVQGAKVVTFSCTLMSNGVVIYN